MLEKDMIMFRAIEAVERIAFQHQSVLATRLTSCCQDYMDWIASTRPKSTDGKPVMADAARMAKLVAYARQTLGPTICKILKEELNMNTHVKIQYALDFYCFTTACFDSIQLPDLLIELYSGMKSYSHLGFDMTIFGNVTKIDTETSKITAFPEKFLMRLNLSPGIFCADELYYGIVPLTAQENAAIIIHEIGHSFVTLEHLSDFYNKASIARNSVTYLQEQADDKTVIEVFKNMEAYINNQPPSTTQAMYSNMCKNIAKDIENTTAQSSVITDNTTQTKHLLAKVVISISALLVVVTILPNLLAFAGLKANARFGELNSSSNKSSDTTVTLSNAATEERQADEFVSRHGLGPQLVSLLIKLNNKDIKDPVIEEVIKNHRVLYFLIQPLITMFEIYGKIVYVDEGNYDNLTKRFEHLLHNNYVVFQNPKLDDELRAVYLKQTKDMIKFIDDYKKDNKPKLRQIFFTVLDRLIDPNSSIVDTVKTAGLSADYDTLQWLTNGLVKNKFSYHAARLKSLQT